MRILHLIDAGRRPPLPVIHDGPIALGPADADILACRLALEAAGHDHRVCLVGERRACGRAESLGLAPDIELSPPLGSPLLARRDLRRALAAWRPDVVHVWDRPSLLLATAANPAGGYAVVRPSAAAGPAPRRRRPLLPEPASTIEIAPSPPAELAPAGRIVHIPPPVRVEPLSPRARAQFRADLGLGPQDVALLLLGTGAHADALRTGFVLGLLREAACSTVGLIPAAAAQIRRAARFQRGFSPARFVVSQRPITELLPAADLALYEGGGPGPTGCWPPEPAAAWTPIARAHAAGIPAVAPHWVMAPDLYPAAAIDACLAHNATLPELARRLLPLVEDAELRRRTAGLVREHLRAQDPAAGFLRGLETAWARAAGLPEPSPRREPAGAMA